MSCHVYVVLCIVRSKFLLSLPRLGRYWMLLMIFIIIMRCLIWSIYCLIYLLGISFSLSLSTYYLLLPYYIRTVSKPALKIWSAWEIIILNSSYDPWSRMIAYDWLFPSYSFSSFYKQERYRREVLSVSTRRKHLVVWDWWMDECVHPYRNGVGGMLLQIPRELPSS